MTSTVDVATNIRTSITEDRTHASTTAGVSVGRCLSGTRLTSRYRRSRPTQMFVLFGTNDGRR